MADEKEENNDTTMWRSISPLQENEDVRLNTHVLSDTRDGGEMRTKLDDLTDLVQTGIPENVDGSLLIPEVLGQQLPVQIDEGGFPGREELQWASEQFGVDPNVLVQAVEGGSFPERKGLQLADQVTPFARESGPAQASNVPTGMPHIREANRHSPTAHPVQQNSNWNFSENPSFVPPQAQTAASLPSLRQTLDLPQTLSPTPAPLQSSVWTAPIPPQDQIDDSLLSLPKTVEYLQTLSSTLAPLQSPVQTACPVSHLAKEACPLLMSQGSRGSGLAQASGVSAGPSLKRYATQALPTSACAVRGRTDPSVPASAQAPHPPFAYPTQTASVPTQAHTADFAPSPALTARPGSHLPRKTPLRVSQVLNRTRAQGESKCPLCKMDLAIHPAISTLRCGHRFHSACLNTTPTALLLLQHYLHPPCPVCGRRD